LGILLQPFIPEKAAELLDLMRVDTADPSKRSFASAAFGADLQYGADGSVTEKKVLFTPLLIEN
jgi:methionyl-tRNA synthetase